MSDGWKCEVCGRTEGELHDIAYLPQKQKAHLVANRFTGRLKRGRPAALPKRAFSSDEWQRLTEVLGSSFDLPSDKSENEAREHIGKQTLQMCGECHEEILSEPIYTPYMVRLFAEGTEGMSRIDRMLYLTEALKRGLEELLRR